MKRKCVPGQIADANGASLHQYLRTDCLMLVFARHGQRGGPPVAGLAGKSLTPLGRRQAARLARRVVQLPLSHIYCSDMARAYQTADLIRGLSPRTPFTVLPELRELSRYDQPDNYPARIGERTRARLHRQRVLRVVRRLRRDHRPGQVVLIVAHGGINRMVITRLCGLRLRDGLPFGQHNASLTVVSVNRTGRAVVRLANCTRHLLPHQILGDIFEGAPAN